MPLDIETLKGWKLEVYNQLHARFGGETFTRAAAAQEVNRSKSGIRDVMDDLQDAGLVFKVAYGLYSFRSPARPHQKTKRTLAEYASSSNPGPKAEAKPVEPLPVSISPRLKHFDFVAAAEGRRQARNIKLAALVTAISEPALKQRMAGR